MGQLDFGHSEVCVRINSVTSGFAEDDLSAIFNSKVLPNSIVVPKVDTLEDIKWVRIFELLILLMFVCHGCFSSNYGIDNVDFIVGKTM